MMKRNVIKRVVKLMFTANDEYILILDRFGDVFRLPAISASKESIEKPELLYGHVSMVTDVLLVDNERFLISADRDEKIRVTHHPSTHLIHNFCLGHTDYVSALCCPSFAPDLLISGGGDGHIIVWDWRSGQEMQRLMIPIEECGEGASDIVTIGELGNESKYLLVAFENKPILKFLEVDANGHVKWALAPITLLSKITSCIVCDGLITVQYLDEISEPIARFLLKKDTIVQLEVSQDLLNALDCPCLNPETICMRSTLRKADMNDIIHELTPEESERSKKRRQFDSILK
eukprot:Partr_v1_DN24927_c0_g1_i2_m45422 putative Required for the formation of N(7)-methylguanine at position 46 (m7G46) in tRNA. In the complex, it is required to stabilize and induce conformational change of the catalytic subunit